MNERELFVSANRIQDEKERESFLDAECGEDTGLKRRILELVDAAKAQDSFLSLPETRISDQKDYDDMGGQIGEYKILEKIGEGGFGIVYLAEQLEPIRRRVAIKVIKPGMDSRQVIARFEAERQALAIMDHPNIAKVLDAGTTEHTNRPYFVMELVKGYPITQFCDDKRLGSRQRLELFVLVCQAIQHAHIKGVIHRDIKPSNVLVAMYDGRPVPKVIDFGIAKAMGQPLTERTLNTGFGAVIGSIEYMSPEQACFNQLDVDTRSDIYSLGVLLYELLAGTPAHTSVALRNAGLLESLRVIRETDPPRPSTRLTTDRHLPSIAANRSTEPSKLMAMLRGELDWIVMKSIDKDRNRRYETPSGFADDVRRFLEGQSVQAHPPSALYQFRKYVHRHGRTIAACTAIGLLLFGLVVSSVWSAVRRSSQVAVHSSVLSKAIEDASLSLGSALGAPIGRESEWIAARSASLRLKELLALGNTSESTHARARDFLERFHSADQDRQLAEQIENVVIMSATHTDLESWQKMERDFRDLFKQRDIDLDQLDPRQVGVMIRNHRSNAWLSDALELWIGTRGQMSTIGGPKLDAQQMQPWADAMYVADPDPVRTGIRKLIYSGGTPTVDQVESVIKGASLESQSPRALSWLATVFAIANAADRSDEIFHLAVSHYPSDFMLNYDFAYALVGQRRWPEAIRYFMRCVAIRPDVAGVWRALGNAFRENGELQRSQEALQRSIQLSPNHQPTLVDLEKTLDLLRSQSSSSKDGSAQNKPFPEPSGKKP